ncbi:MAG: YlcI/YnfO family protein [Acidovorax sp.]
MSTQKTVHTRLTLRIPQAMQDKAKAKAEGQHISLNSFIVRAIERAVAQKGQPQ